MTDFLTPLPLYRNIVITRACVNNNKIVLLIVLLYCYSSTAPEYVTNTKQPITSRDKNACPNAAFGRHGSCELANAVKGTINAPFPKN